VVVGHGPATERGWLALRTALALGLGGCDVTVLLDGPGAAFGRAGLDARAWLDGDAGADLDGLVAELDADVVVAGAHDGALRPGVRRVDPGGDTVADLVRAADLVVPS
jgi:hypothetical protein